MSGSLTTDRSTRSHLVPMNLQIFFDDSDPLVLGHYRFIVGLADYNGAIVYDTMKATLGDFRPINDNGAIVFAKVMADPRGGMMTLVAMLFDQVSGRNPVERRHSCRYGKVTEGRILFQGTVIKSQDTETENSATDKTTIGGKGGLSYGIGNAEISGSREHQGPGGSVASTYAGALRDFSVVWLQK